MFFLSRMVSLCPSSTCGLQLCFALPSRYNRRPSSFIYPPFLWSLFAHLTQLCFCSFSKEAPEKCSVDRRCMIACRTLGCRIIRNDSVPHHPVPSCPRLSPFVPYIHVLVRCSARDRQIPHVRVSGRSALRTSAVLPIIVRS